MGVEQSALALVSLSGCVRMAILLSKKNTLCEGGNTGTGRRFFIKHNYLEKIRVFKAGNRIIIAHEYISMV